MPKDVARDFWIQAFPAVRRFWASNAIALTKEALAAMPRSIRELWTEEMLTSHPPSLADVGQVSVRANADGTYTCWAATVAEHPNSSKIFVRLEVNGEVKDGRASCAEVTGHPGDGGEGSANDAIVDRSNQLDDEGYVTVIVEKGAIIDD